jgi:predicted PurR-regulated permease PerM
MSLSGLNTHWRMRWFHTAVILIIIYLVLWAFSSLAGILVPGFLIAFLLKPIVDRFEAKGWSRPISAIVALFSVTIVIVAAGFLLLPNLVEQFAGLQERKGELLIIAKDQMHNLREFSIRYIPEDKVTEFQKEGQKWVENNLGALLTYLPAIAGFLFSWISNFMFALVVAFLLLEDSTRLTRFFLGLVPNRYFELVLRLQNQLGEQLGGYLRGQSMDCLANGILYAIGLSIMGVPAGVAAGLIAGLFNAIPYAGPVIGMALCFLVDLSNPGSNLVWWAIPLMFIVVQVLDNIAIYPLTVGKSLKLSPLAVILAILFGGKAAGVLGILLAVPLLAMALSSFTIFHRSLKAYRIL